MCDLVAGDRTDAVQEALAAAKVYAQEALARAQTQGEALLADAAAAGRKDAAALIPKNSPDSPEVVAQQLKLQKAEVEKTESAVRASVEEASALHAEVEAKKVQVAAEQATAEAKAQAAKAEAEQQAVQAQKDLKQRQEQDALALSPFTTTKLSADKAGVFGGVSFGLPLSESIPTTPVAQQRNSAFNRFKKFDKKKDIYGRKKSCLKDIAAHFDEKDIYETKKMSLLQEMSSTKSRALATQIRSRLESLETWHQMMQKKFLMSATEMKVHKQRVAALMEEHLPQELKDQLAQNKVAKRAAQKIPFPDAHAQAMKILRSKRLEIQKNENLKALGHKRMLRPEINDKGFPSMDPISSSLREKLWRTVETQDEWSTDSRDLEKAENIVTNAHKAHGDFVDGPIAAPMLKDLLFNPDTERLGVPNFLTKFPWPLVDEKVTMDDKVKVEQTYSQTW